jgi:hypothetical protein
LGCAFVVAGSWRRARSDSTMNDKLTRRLADLFGDATEHFVNRAPEINQVLMQHFNEHAPCEKRILFSMAQHRMNESMDALRKKSGRALLEIVFDDDLVRQYPAELVQVWLDFLIYLSMKMRLGAS